MRASKLQEMLGVEDGFVVAYGYTFNRKTLYWVFKQGLLFRVKVDVEGKVLEFLNTEEIATLPWDPFSNDVKRIYEDCTHPVLTELLRAFSNGTSFTKTGRGGDAMKNLRELSDEFNSLVTRSDAKRLQP
jgi:hypothetical protein